MKIQDKHYKEWYVELKPTCDYYDICELRAEVNLGHGRFTAWSDSVPMLKMREFISQFELFIRDKEVKPRLEGVYNSYFSFYSKDGSVLMKFSVGDAACGPFEFNLKGLLEIDANILPSILLDFKELAR
jgi:hypothetical protein